MLDLDRNSNPRRSRWEQLLDLQRCYSSVGWSRLPPRLQLWKLRRRWTSSRSRPVSGTWRRWVLAEQDSKQRACTCFGRRPNTGRPACGVGLIGPVEPKLGSRGRIWGSTSSAKRRRANSGQSRRSSAPTRTRSFHGVNWQRSSGIVPTRRVFSHRLVITNTWDVSHQFVAATEHQSIGWIGRSELLGLGLDWRPFIDAKAAPTVQRKLPRPHQVRAIDAVVAHLADHERGQLVMACGTGKTLTTLGSARPAETSVSWSSSRRSRSCASSAGNGSRRVTQCARSSTCASALT